MLDIAILEGVRTPFVKAFGPLAGTPAQELGRAAAVEVLRRADLSPDRVDQVVFGNVARPADAANVARVIALTAGVPQDRIAHTVQRNCASGMEAITTAAQLLQLDEARTVVAGGCTAAGSGSSTRCRRPPSRRFRPDPPGAGRLRPGEPPPSRRRPGPRRARRGNRARQARPAGS